MATLNYTTSIAATKTAAEIQATLGRHGAEAVAVRYAEGKPIGLSFGIHTSYGLRYFDLPVNPGAVHQLLQRQADRGTIRRSYANGEQAERTAWRVVKVWIESQLAIIESQMVTLDQVMLPYLRVDEDRTLYQAFRAEQHLALTDGSQG